MLHDALLDDHRRSILWQLSLGLLSELRQLQLAQTLAAFQDLTVVRHCKQERG